MVGKYLQVLVTTEDPYGGTGTFTATTAAVANVNADPTFSSDAVTNATQGLAYSYTVTTNDIDEDNVTLEATTKPDWLSFSNGVLSGTPGNSDVGNNSVEITASDGKGGTATQSFTIVVANANDAPTVSNTILDVVVNEDAANEIIDLNGRFTDLDNDNLTFSATSNNEDLVTVSVLGTELTLDFQLHQHGSTTIEVTADDNEGGTVTTNFTVTVISQPDATTGSVTIDGDVEEGGTVTANTTGLYDPDGTVTITSYQWQSKVSGTSGAINIAGATNSTYDIPDDQTMVNHHLGVIVTTNDGTPFESAFSPIVDVNDPPFFLDNNNNKLSVDTITIEMNESNGTNLEVYNARARDVENHGITFSLDGVDASDFSINSTTGVVKLLAAPTPGTKTFKVIASDTYNATSTLNLTLNINSTAVVEVRYTKTAGAGDPPNANPNIPFANNNVTKVEVKFNKNNVPGNTNGTEYILTLFETMFDDVVVWDNGATMNYNQYLDVSYGPEYGSEALKNGWTLNFGDNQSTLGYKVYSTTTLTITNEMPSQRGVSSVIHANDTWVTLFYAKHPDGTTALPVPTTVSLHLFPFNNEADYNENNRMYIENIIPVEVII